MTRQERIQLVSDGVVASYIHDISARTAPSARARRQAGQPHRRAVRPAYVRPTLRVHHVRSHDLVGTGRGR
jgi:hypothetical protein